MVPNRLSASRRSMGLETGASALRQRLFGLTLEVVTHLLGGVRRDNSRSLPASHSCLPRRRLATDARQRRDRIETAVLASDE